MHLFMAVGSTLDRSAMLDAALVVPAPARCGYRSIRRYDPHMVNETRDAKKMMQTHSAALHAGNTSFVVAQIVVTGSGHTSTSWTMRFLAESPSILAPPVHDMCISPPGACWPVHDSLFKEAHPTLRAHEWAPGKALFKGPCKVCFLPVLLGPCAQHGQRIVGLVRNPLDHWQSTMRRDPGMPRLNFFRWVFDNSALLQYWGHPSSLLVRYEDMSANDTTTRLRTFGEIFDFLGLPPMSEAMRRRCCYVEQIHAASASVGANASASAPSCEEQINEVGVHHTTDKRLTCDATTAPLVHKVEGWRSLPHMVDAALDAMRKASKEALVSAAVKGRMPKVEDSIVYRLSRAFRYFDEDPLVRLALDWNASFLNGSRLRSLTL